MTDQRPIKILVIRFSSIGDIVLTTPVVRALKQQLGCEVHYITKKSFQKIVTPNPHIDKVFFIEKNVSEVLNELKSENYHHIIDLHKNLRSQQIRWSLSAKYHTFDKLNIDKWLMVNFKYDRLPRVHIVMRYMKAVESLGVTYDDDGLDYFFYEKKPTFQDEKLTEVSQSDYIAFAIGGAHATKRLPAQKIISICQKIKIPIILLGGKDDATTGNEIVLSNQTNVFNLCGKLTLDESAWMVKNATKVISHDTGMMHIAAAFQKEIVSIWGSTIPEFGMYPFLKSTIDGQEELNESSKIIEVKGLSCRPCSKIGFEKCPKGHFKCMQDIDEAAIINAIND